MEDLIRQAFLHVEVLGPHVHEGHYDLVGPKGEVILPQTWETVVEPDWAVTMQMWPWPEMLPQPEEPKGAPNGSSGEPDITVTGDNTSIKSSKKKPKDNSLFFAALFGDSSGTKPKSSSSSSSKRKSSGKGK
jgi:hypothetical protein